MKKRLISIFMAVITAVTAILCVSVPSAAASAKSGLTVTGKAADGYITVDLNGLTEKQYKKFINGEKGFRVELASPDGKTVIFIAADFTSKTTEPAIPGYEGGRPVYCGISGNNIIEHSTWNSAMSLEALDGTAAKGTWGFRWKFKSDDKTIKAFMPYLTACAELVCSFKDVYKNPVEVGKYGSELTIPAKWADGISGNIDFELQENTFRKGYISAVLTVPAADYTKFRNTKNAALKLGLWCGKTSSTLEMKQDGSISYLSKQDGADISKKMYVDAKAQADGTVKFAFSFKAGSKAAKSLLAEKITGQYGIVSGSKYIAGSAEKVQLRGLPEKVSAPEKPVLFLKGSSLYTAVVGWEEQSGVDGYQVYMSVNGGKFTKVASVGTFPRLYSAENLNTDKNTYKIRIRGYVKPVGKKTLYSKWSNTVTVK